jgi:serine/threonine protein kinase
VDEDAHDDHTEAFVGAGQRYQICDEIGRGGAGRVHIGIDRDLNRHVAVKVLTRQSRESITRFLNEAQIMAKLQHPGIVPIYGIGSLKRGRKKPELYYAMEMVEGKTLRQVIEERADNHREWTLASLLRIYERICQIVAYAHSRQVVHRDLKPENIMIGEFGKVFVMDWGIAKDLEEGHAELPIRQETPEAMLTQTFTRNLTDMEGGGRGTPGYMSPEQVLGMASKVDYRTDVFSLGVILYEILTGRNPFTKDDPRATYNAIKNETPSRPNLRLEYKPFAGICAKALSKLPGDRFADAGRLADDVTGALELRTVSSHRGSIFHHAFRLGRRHRLIATILIGIAALVTSVGYFVISENREVERLVSMADARLLSVTHYNDRIAILDERITRSPAALKQELSRLKDALVSRREANAAAARSYLTLALEKRGARLENSQRTKLKSLWLAEVEREINQGNLDGARYVIAELDALGGPSLFPSWTRDDQNRLDRCEAYLDELQQ